MKRTIKHPICRIGTLTFTFVLVAVLWQASAHAQALVVFEDKAAFLGATGATSATGPLPNIGVVADSDNPTGSGTVGSITFSLAPGGNNLYIGANGTGAAPDWYLPTSGNDIALGYENLRVRTASPVFALGFDIVEPEATMPGYGGTPVDSTYKVTLYQGAATVGETVVRNLPKDVVAFVGVWSTTAFDRVDIVDVTQSPFVDDDEYFGEFYTGTLAAPPTTLTAVSRTGVSVPGGTGTFTAFPQSPVMSLDVARFFGLGNGGEAGVYSCDSAIPTEPCQPIANLTTVIPGGAGTFTNFTQLAASSTITSFIATGAGQTGVYSCPIAAPVQPCQPVANLTTVIPGGTGPFTGFTQVAAGSTDTSFIGTGSGQTGVGEKGQCCTGSLQWSPDNNQLIFLPGNRRRVTLWDARAQTTSTIYVAPYRLQALTASWAGDDPRIVFSIGAGQLELKTMDLLEDGRKPGEIRTLFSGGFSGAYSSDGRWIAFARTFNGETDLWMADADGREARRLTTNLEVGLREPHWSPDGFLPRSSVGASDLLSKTQSNQSIHAISGRRCTKQPRGTRLNGRVFHRRL